MTEVIELKVKDQFSNTHEALALLRDIPEHAEARANSNMRCDSLKSLMIINKLSKFL